MNFSKVCVGVLFGGSSGEHSVSIQSARTVINALKSKNNINRYNVLPIYIDRKGRWRSEEVAEDVLKHGESLYEDKNHYNSSTEEGFINFPKGSNYVDVWFPVLHGPNGEDGTVQGLFKLMKKPFVGSGVLGSAVGMDKIAMKAAFAQAGLPQVPYEFVTANEIKEISFLDNFVKNLEKKLGYPCFIKPANLGSSVGISKVFNREQLFSGLNNVVLYDNRIILEKGLNARELECGVLGNNNLMASVVGEIVFDSDWYDYETKYSQSSSSPIIPASLPDSLTSKIRQYAVNACRAVGAYGMARVDFFYEDLEESLWINEINTIPGFTSQSMYPMLWEASGVSIDELVSNLVDLARE